MAGLGRTADPAMALRRPIPAVPMPVPMPVGGWRYLIALGSNVRHHRHGLPAAVLAAALEGLAGAGLDRYGLASGEGLRVLRVSPIIASAPMGPSRRRYANGAALITCPLSPPDLLALLKAVEREFGRRARGQRWGARVLDLDIVLWQGGGWRSAGRRGDGFRGDLVIPHRHFRGRDFVLGPAAVVAPEWRDPATGLSLRQLAGRHRRAMRQGETTGRTTP